VLADVPGGKLDLILIATGSEVSLITAAQRQLAEKGIAARAVSMPSWELFDAQPREYRDEVLPPSVRARLAVEAGVPQGWCKYVGDEGDVIGLDHFGASAPAKVVLEKFGYTVDNVVTHAIKLVK
jgi:transketolase